MRYKKQIVLIMTLTILLLLMMSTAMQAVSIVGNISNFKATMNANRIKLSWDSVSNSAGYNVYVNGTKIGSVSSNEVSLMNFSENTTYRLRVTAYDNKNAETAISDEISFTTTTNQTNLGRVENLTVTQSNGFVTLNWSKVNKADKYQVFVDIPGFGNMNIGEVTTTSAILRGFTDGVRYGFSIRACQTLENNNVSYGAKSVAKYITIDFDNNDTNNDNDNKPTKPNKVTNVRASNITETTATVTWNEVAGADGYDVLVSKNYGSYQTVISKTGNTVALANLTQNSYYRVKVVAYKKVNNEKVYGEESSYTSFTTKKENITIGNVATISVNSLTKNEAKISWSNVSGATGYYIYLAKGTGVDQYMGKTSNRSYVFSNLQANTSYTVKIEAYKIVNGKEYKSKTKASKVFTTSKETLIKPATPKNLTVEVRNRNEAYLTWWQVEGATGYQVEISKNGGAYECIATISQNNIVLTSKNMEYATNYKVRVRAYKSQYVNGKYQNGYGSYSNVVSFKTESYDQTINNTSVGTVSGLKASVNKTTVTLNWNKVNDVAGYEIDLTIPGIGHIPYYTSSNSADISGITGKEYNYTARVRAYKYINGKKIYGSYSKEIVKFKEN